MYPQGPSLQTYPGNVPWRPGYFFDISLSKYANQKIESPGADQGTDFSMDDGYSIGSMPGSFKSDRLTADEARVEQSGIGDVPEGTLVGAVNQDGEEVYISPEGRADYFIRNQRPEGASMATDEQLEQFRKNARQEKRDARQDKWAANQPKREARVNKALAIANTVVGAKERANDLIREQQIKDEAWQNQFVMAYKPSDRGKYMTNMDVFTPPTQQTPVQFEGNAYKQGYGYGKKGGSVMYLTEKQIRDIISLGGEVEFIK